MARLGHSAGIIGGVGKDDFGACILKRLKGHGVEVRWVLEVPDRSTAVAFVTYFADGSRKFIYHIDGTREAPKFFHVMGCSLMANDRFRASIFDAVSALHEKGTKISFDPNIRPELLAGRDVQELVGPVLDRCAVLLPGVSELQLLAGVEGVQESIRALFARKALQTIVYPVKEVDPTGAGDSFDAGFLCGLLEGRPLAGCLKVAAAAGALNAASFGPMEGNISARTVGDLMSGS